MHLKQINVTARTVDFDPIQFLIGQDAIAAFHKDNPGAKDGPPNDYYIVNASPHIYKARVAANVVVWDTRSQDGGSNTLKAETFAGLVQYLAAHKTNNGFLAYNPYWLTLSNREVTTICEQWVP